MGFFADRNERARRFLRRAFNFKVQVIYGREGRHDTPYLTRIRLWNVGLHIFHRGDEDPDPHDHPFDFWTFPLTSYVEDVYNPKENTARRVIVRAWKWHFRPAEHSHRVIGRFSGDDEYTGYFEPQTDDRKVYTVVVFGQRRRDWGFWQNRIWVHWRRYVYPGKTSTWID